MRIEHVHWGGQLGHCPACGRRDAPEVWLLYTVPSYEEADENPMERVCRDCLGKIYDRISDAMDKAEIKGEER